MIKYISGNLFDSNCQTLVNTVNCVGVMGKGIALQFKNKFPDMFLLYRKLCNEEKFFPGCLWLWKPSEISMFTQNQQVLCFATKNHWRYNSQIEWIEHGLRTFVTTYKQKGITSVAFPKLGCSNGHLNWNTQVKPLMEKYLSRCDIPIEIYI